MRKIKKYSQLTGKKKCGKIKSVKEILSELWLILFFYFTPSLIVQNQEKMYANVHSS